MDIRKFFKGTLKRKKAETSSESSDDEKKEESSLALAQAGSLRVQNTLKWLQMNSKRSPSKRRHRSENIIETSQGTASALGTDFQVPRIASRQQHRSNHPAQSSSDYWKRSIIIPYLDSLISALDQRFSNEHLPAFSLMSLHPNTMLSMTLSDFQENCKAFTNFYELAIEPEAELWYKLWKDKGIPNEELEKMDFTDTLKEANTFFPATKRAILILLAQPCTTANIERSFSTLRRVKTWLRSTMSENRLNGLCMLSVHRKMVEGKKGEVIEKVLNRFCEQPRKLLFK
ncbi:unnamed protein product [Colias eurytheme]|nr:unnamed protein product [Colias eurytheme]